MKHREETSVGPILAETSCRFRKPLTYPDCVWVGTRVTQMGHDRFVQAYRIVSQKEDQLIAEGESLTVAFDYRKNAKAAFPPTVKKAIEALQGGPVPPLPAKK
jgi:acyl-CoA thioester hydrolase